MRLKPSSNWDRPIFRKDSIENSCDLTDKTAR
jgi:hypothetical protein